MTDYDDLKLEKQLCFRLYTASRAVTRRYTPYLEPLGLTYTQYIAMMVLWERGQVTVGALCAQLGLETSTVTPMLKKLQAAGYVSRSRSAEDERVCVIEPTEAGWQLRERAAQVPACMVADLGVDEALVEQLISLLDRFNEDLFRTV